jgi:alanine racemase
MRTAWIEVNLFALKENLKKLRNCTSPGTDIMAVIKADAYGHGALKVAHLYRDERISRFAVALIQEGIELRENGINEQILIIGPILEEEISELIRYNLTPTISTYYQAKKLNDIAALHDKKLNIHIEIDTGMGRLGFIVNDETAPNIVKISQLPNISIEGIYTHLATADRLKDLAYVEMQYEKFMTVLQQIEDAGVYVPLKHMCNSAATINFPKMHLDMVRPGTALYGLYPGPEMAVNPKVELIPAMSIKAKLVFIKSVPIGTKGLP